MSERPVFVLIDGYAQAYRHYHAMKTDVFKTSSGEPTNSVYGFARTLLDIIEKEKPDYLAVSFDKGLGGRDKIYPAYKGTRSEMPIELEVQIPRLYQLVKALNIPILELDTWEADDVIGTVAKLAEAVGVHTRIITGDKDILQLLTEHVSVQMPQWKGDDRVITLAEFQEKYGFNPDQFIDFKALIGDTSDNIPGVDGIGDKTATVLIQTYKTLDGIYEHVHELKDMRGKVMEKLLANKDNAYLSQKLATIVTDLPIAFDLEKCRTHDFEFEPVDSLFAVLEFRSMRDRLARIKSVTIKEDAPEAQSTDNLFNYETVIIRTEEQLNDLVQKLNNAERIVWDTETTGIDPMIAKLVGIALAVDETTGYYIPVGHSGRGIGTLFEEPAENQLSLELVMDALRPVLTNPKIGKVAHNATYDLLMMANHGIEVTPVEFDTMIAEWVRDPISRFLGLKNFARHNLKIHMQEITELIGTGKKQIPMSQVEIDKVAPYASADAVVTIRARNFLVNELTTPSVNMNELYHKLEIPIIPIVAKMERVGALLDIAELSKQGTKLAEYMHTLEEKIFAEAGVNFNINSPQQLNQILFEKLNLPNQGIKKTMHGYSTDAVVLEALSDKHPIVPLVMDYRELSKLKSTYVDALPMLINPKTGRVHTSYNQTGTSTGRFSSSNPNLQNIPIRTELGRDIRKAFIAESGKVLLSVDYSQIELRVMAHMSGDITLQQAFHEGQDVHAATASAVFGVPLADVSYDQRSFAKRINFGLMYGMGAFRLARDSELTKAQADKFIATYFDRLPKVKEYLERTKQEAREKGYVETLFGRRRFFPVLKSGGNAQAMQAEERAAINAPIQGTAADILKMAMLKLDKALAVHPDVSMTLQVHDELVFEVPENKVAEVADLITTLMQNALDDNPIKPVQFAVPLKANAEFGLNWLDMQAVK
jgi:DNA polymerase I